MAQTTEVTPALARSSSRTGSSALSGSGPSSWASGSSGRSSPERGDERVGLLEQREVVGVALRDVLREVGREPERAVVIGGHEPEQRDAAALEVTEVDGAPAVRSADRDRDVRGALRRSLRVPLVEDAEPPAEVTPAVAARRTVVGTDAEVDAPAGAAQLVRDLHAGRPRPHDEDRAVGQLARVAIAARVDLRDVRVLRDDRRDQRLLERAGRRDDVARLDRAVARLGPEAGPALVPAHGEHLDAAADRCVDLSRVGLEVLDDLLLGGEPIPIDVELQPGEPVMPRGPVRDQRVPPLRAPPLGDAAPLEDQMRHAAGAQMLAHREAGLATPDDQHLHSFVRHVEILRDPVGPFNT